MWTAYAQCIESIIWVSVCVSVHCSVSSSVSVYQRVSSVAIALACGCEEGRGVDCFGLRARFARIDLCHVLEAGPERSMHRVYYLGLGLCLCLCLCLYVSVSVSLSLPLSLSTKECPASRLRSRAGVKKGEESTVLVCARGSRGSIYVMYWRLGRSAPRA